MPKSRTTSLVLLIVTTLCFAVAFGFAVHMQARIKSGREPLPRLHTVAPFALTNAAGRSFSTASLTGKVWTASLFFTSCQTVCPILTANLTGIQGAYADNPDVSIVQISVDPDRDTPAAMRAYGERYGADSNRWQFLAGPLPQIREISLERLRIGSKDRPIDHSPYVALIDRSARVRGYYNGMDAESIERLERDMGRLLEEGP